MCHIDSTTHRKAWLPCWGAKAAAEVAQRAVRARESLTMVAMEQPKEYRLGRLLLARERQRMQMAKQKISQTWLHHVIAFGVRGLEKR